MTFSDAERTTLSTPAPDWAKPIWVDFMAMDDASRVPLDYRATMEDLTRYRVELRDGLPLVLYTLDATEAGDDDPLLGVGFAEFDSAASRWFAKFDVKALGHLSDLDAERRSTFASSYDIARR